MVRIPFSVYSGWVTCATVLNTFYMLKSWGMSDDIKYDANKNAGNGWWSWLRPMMFMNEENWTILSFWGVGVFFEVVSWWERNPIWGSVFTWAGSAILAKNIAKMTELEKVGKSNSTIIANVGIVLFIHAASMGVEFIYLFIENLQPYFEPISFWQGGVFG